MYNGRDINIRLTIGVTAGIGAVQNDLLNPSAKDLPINRNHIMNNPFNLTIRTPELFIVTHSVHPS